MLDRVNSKEIRPSISYGKEGKAFSFKDKERLLEAFRPNERKKYLQAILQKDPLTYKNKTLSVPNSTKEKMEQLILQTDKVLRRDCLFFGITCYPWELWYSPTGPTSSKTPGSMAENKLPLPLWGECGPQGSLSQLWSTGVPLSCHLSHGGKWEEPV